MYEGKRVIDVEVSPVDLIFFFSDSEAQIERSRNIPTLVIELHCFVILVLHTYIHTDIHTYSYNHI